MPNFNKYRKDYYSILETTLNGYGIKNSSDFFAFCKAWHLSRFLTRANERILDWGCGHGLTTWHVSQRFPAATVHGYDPADKVIASIPQELQERVTFYSDTKAFEGKYDTIFASGVLHHVAIQDRQNFLDQISKSLTPNGKLFIFEHNPYNPLALKIMDSCPFDDDAIPVTPTTARRLINEAGYNEEFLNYISFIPPVLKSLLPLERVLGWCPFGLQYVLCASRIERS